MGAAAAADDGVNPDTRVLCATAAGALAKVAKQATQGRIAVANAVAQQHSSITSSGDAPSLNNIESRSSRWGITEVGSSGVGR
jgi:hypothetical protein